jgi:hypothetical protein
VVRSKNLLSWLSLSTQPWPRAGWSQQRRSAVVAFGVRCTVYCMYCVLCTVYDCVLLCTTVYCVYCVWFHTPRAHLCRVCGFGSLVAPAYVCVCVNVCGYTARALFCGAAPALLTARFAENGLFHTSFHNTAKRTAFDAHQVRRACVLCVCLCVCEGLYCVSHIVCVCAYACVCVYWFGRCVGWRRVLCT